LSNVFVSREQQILPFAPFKNGLIVSCQVPDGTPIDTPEFIAAQAQTVLLAGAVGIRAQGIRNVAAVVSAVSVPVIGLVKRYSERSQVFITPEIDYVLELEQAGAAIVAVDATIRLRENAVSFSGFMEKLRSKTDIPIMADIDSLEAAILAESLGCGAVATTLSGYTETPAPRLPNIELIREISGSIKIPVIAEGGFNKPEQIVQAFNAGAWSVCVGTAITNPFLLTKSFVQAIKPQY
jgi:N-acylglucosamine-6-phosphate 2-epimerase